MRIPGSDQVSDTDGVLRNSFCQLQSVLRHAGHPIEINRYVKRDRRHLGAQGGATSASSGRGRLRDPVKKTPRRTFQNKVPRRTFQNKKAGLM